MRSRFATLVGALAIVSCAVLGGCGDSQATTQPTLKPAGPPIAEVLIHVEIKSVTPPSAAGDGWQVTFNKNGQDVTAPTASGVDVTLLVPGSKVVIRGTLTQAGDLTITSVTPDAP